MKVENSGFREYLEEKRAERTTPDNPQLILILGSVGSQKTAQATNYFNMGLRAGKKPIKIRITPKVEGLKQEPPNSSNFVAPPNVELETVTKHYEMVILDDIHNLKPNRIVDIIELVETHRKFVVCCGLDLDTTGKPYGNTARLACYADTVLKLKSVCSDCFKPATYSFQLDMSPAEKIKDGQDIKPLCRDCFRFYMSAKSEYYKILGKV